MKKNISIILFVIFAATALYLSKINYSEHSLKKSIAACIIAQIKKSDQITKEYAEDFCKKEIKN